MTNLALLLYVLAIILLFREAARRWTERRFDVCFVAAGLAAAVTAWILLPPATPPVELITELHEGRTLLSIKSLYARGAHSMQAHDLVLYLTSGRDGVDLRDAVRLNVSLTVLGAWLVGLFAARLGGRWSVGVVAAGLFLASPPVLNAAVSSYGAPLGTVLVLLAVPSLERVWRVDSRRGERGEAFVLVLVLLGLSSLVRLDWATGLVLWVACGLPAVFRDAAWMPRVRSVVARLFRPWPVRVGLVVGLVALNFLPLRGKAHWVLSALQPLSFELAYLPSLAARLAVPLGVVVLLVVGAVSLWRLGPAGWWGALVVGGLFKLFHVAGHGVDFEYLRYLTAWVAPALLLAAVGWRAVASRLQGRRLGAATGALLALSLLVSPWLPSSVSAVYGTEDPVWPPARNKQREIRALLRAVEEYPQCLFVSRVSRSGSGAPTRWQYTFFGEGVSAPLSVPEFTEAADPLAAALSASRIRQPRCLMLYRGQDCNLVGADCESIEAGLEEISEWRSQSRRYSDSEEYGPWRSPLRFGIYRVPLASLASNGHRAPP